jgi:peptidoglycan/LPS O-acetylase OafA/YrhL
LQPTWSLAVEEPFYALWPWLAFRLKRETIFKFCFAVVALSPLLRMVLLQFRGDQFVYENTLSRLDGIAFGGVLAAWVRAPRFAGENMKQFALQPLPFACAVISFWFAMDSLILACLAYSFVALACGGMVALALVWNGRDRAHTRFFRQGWLMWMGKVSFALYLFNYPIYTMVHGNHGMSLASRLHLGAASAQMFYLVIGNALLFAAVWVSWHLLESPALKLKSRWAPR